MTPRQNAVVLRKANCLLIATKSVKDVPRQPVDLRLFVVNKTHQFQVQRSSEQPSNNSMSKSMTSIFE